MGAWFMVHGLSPHGYINSPHSRLDIDDGFNAVGGTRCPDDSPLSIGGDPCSSVLICG